MSWIVLLTLIRRLRLLIGVSFLFGAVAGTQALFKGRAYTATASFISQEAGAPQGGIGALASQFGLVVGRSAAATPLFYVELLRSKTFLREVLRTPYRTIPGGSLLTYLRIPEGDSAVRIERGINRVREILRPSADRQTGIIKFTVTFPRADLAAEVAERVLAVLEEFNVQRRQSVGRAEREFLERRTTVASESLRAAERALTDFYARNRNFGESPELRQQEERLKRAQLLRSSLFTTLSQNLEAARLEEVRSTPQITVLERPAGLVETGGRGLIRKTVLGAAAGLVVGCIIVLLLQLLSPSSPLSSDEALAEVRATLLRMTPRRPNAI
jgi:uncharacterized protein involved in exopolysaccharide biosynthesis